jgi:hypothetical protein
MQTSNENVIKRGEFNDVSYSCAKKYFCKKGQLTLTKNSLSIECKGTWSKVFPILNVDLRAEENGLLVVYDITHYGRLFLKLMVDNPKEWETALNKVKNEEIEKYMHEFYQRESKEPEELERIFDISPELLRKLFDELRKEKISFENKNVLFNFYVQDLMRKVRNRKLQAFMVAHNYVAMYEWTKRFMSKIYKAKLGKGPTNDEELMIFLDDYPSWKYLLDTSEWDIKPNQIRNCVAHQKFYFDYRSSELVFMLGKEKRVPLNELRRMVGPMAHFYSTLLTSLKEKITTGKISYRSYHF